MRTALRRPGRLFYLLLIVASTLNAYAAPTTATVSGVIYRADGTPASGTLLISWPAFNTAGGDAVAAGSMSLAIGPSGAISLALAPTEGATPAGVSYKVIYKLNDGTTSTETWVVPAAGPVTIAAIRARVSSSTMALAWGNATQLQGKPIATTAPQNGQTLIYSAAGSRYEPQMPVAEVPDADAVTKGKVQLAGDLGGTASAPTVPALAAKANQSALDATNNAAATHYSSTAAHSAAAIPAANRIVMSGAAGKLDKGWLPSAVDPMTLGTGANGSALSIKSPDASNFLRISAIDNGPNPGQVDAACGAMHDIFYPFGYNSVYGANYDASKPTFEETLETNWCPGDGHAYFEWYKQFYAPWTGGAVAPIRPISFQVRKDGSAVTDYWATETHDVAYVHFRHLPTDPFISIALDVPNGIITATKFGKSDAPAAESWATQDCVVNSSGYRTCRTVSQYPKSGACTHGDSNYPNDGGPQVCVLGTWYKLARLYDQFLTLNFFTPTGWAEPNLGRIGANALPAGGWTLTRIHVDMQGGAVPTCTTTQPSIGYFYGSEHNTTLAAGAWFQDVLPSAAIDAATGFTVRVNPGVGCGAMPAANITIWLQRTS